MGVSELVDGIKAKTVLLQMEKHRLIYQIVLVGQENIYLSILLLKMVLLPQK